MPKASIDPVKIAVGLMLKGKVYVSVKTLAVMLGVSTRTAGKILAEMERRGVAERWSKRTYKLRLTGLKTVGRYG